MFDKKIIVIGSGSWGTAIANILAENNRKILLYSRNQETIYDINHNHLNTKYLANNVLNKNIIATNEPSNISDCEFIFLAIPTQKLNQLFELKNFIPNNATLVICNKGINIKSLKLPSETLNESFNNEIAVLGGPNFALEIIQKKPSAAIIASKNKDTQSNLAKLLSTNYFSVHTSDDIIGTQVCGAIKNVYAIACGMIAGLNLGENAKAALITNALNEIKTLITYFRGNITSLSPAALIIVHEMGYKWTKIAGPQFWTYKGKTLYELNNQ